MIAAGAMLASSGGAANAEPLTCTAFRERFAVALHAQAPPPGIPTPSFAPAGDRRSVQRIAWQAGPDLSGLLTCGADDAFADFYVRVAPEARGSGTLPPAAPAFTALGAASVCALSAAAPSECRDFATRMIGDAADSYDDDLKNKDDHPQGLQDLDFGPDVDAVFYLTPTAMSWAVGPGLYAHAESERVPLAVKEHPENH